MPAGTQAREVLVAGGKGQESALAQAVELSLRELHSSHTLPHNVEVQTRGNVINQNHIPAISIGRLNDLNWDGQPVSGVVLLKDPRANEDQFAAARQMLVDRADQHLQGWGETTVKSNQAPVPQQLPGEAQAMSFEVTPMPNLKAAAANALPKGFHAAQMITLPGADEKQVNRVKDALALALYRLMDNPSFPKVHVEAFDPQRGAFMHTSSNPLAFAGVTNYAEQPGQAPIYGVILGRDGRSEDYNYTRARDLVIREANELLKQQGAPGLLPTAFPYPAWMDR